MASESILQAFDRFTAHVLSLLDSMRKENSDTYATKKYVQDNSGKIDKVLVNGSEQVIGTDKSININLDDYATKSFVDEFGGKIDKILVNGIEKTIEPDKSVNIDIPGSTLSVENESVYLTGVKNSDGESYYTKDVYFNPKTGELHANTVNAEKVYGAVWNDYAEWFEKADIETKFKPGDICAWSKNGVVKATKDNCKVIVGVCSDTYGHILGGEKLKDMESNSNKFVPIGLAGRVKVTVIGKVNIGDYIIPSVIAGVGTVDNFADPRFVVGQALETKEYCDAGRITILIK